MHASTNPRSYNGLQLLASCLLTGLLWSCCGAGNGFAAESFRTLEGKYVRVITDLPDTPATRQWTSAFDAAVPQFCEFWQVPLESIAGWRTTACVMSQKGPFVSAGLLPTSIPDFPHGFQSGNNLWVLNQPSDYYTRHLLIHEGAHAFAFHVFGGAGPAWFMEGTAEYLATHRWNGQNIELGVVPESSSAFPYWGRFKMINARKVNQQALSLVSVLRYSDTAHRQVEPYAWTWAAVLLFASEPETRQLLIDAARNGRDASPEFTRQFVAALGDQWPKSQIRWQLLIHDVDYGYDLPANRLSFNTAPKPWDGSTTEFQVSAENGWQSSGVIVQKGTKLKLSATGTFTLTADPKPWTSDAAGVTIKYHKGRPLGTLIACVVPLQTQPAKLVQPLNVLQVANAASWTVPETGWLLLKIADDPADLSNNQGSLLVRLQTAD